MNAWADYASADAHKLLTDNRDLYIAQSKATTTTGGVADFHEIARAMTEAEGRQYERTEMMDGRYPSADNGSWA